MDIYAPSIQPLNVFTRRDARQLDLSWEEVRALQEALEKHEAEQAKRSRNQSDWFDYLERLYYDLMSLRSEDCSWAVERSLERRRNRLLGIFSRWLGERRFQRLARLAKAPLSIGRVATRSAAANRRQVAPIAAPPQFA